MHSALIARVAPKFSSPRSLHVLVAGGAAGKFSSFAPGFGVGRRPMPTANLSTAASRRVEALSPMAEAEAELLAARAQEAQADASGSARPLGEYGRSGRRRRTTPRKPTSTPSPTAAPGGSGLLLDPTGRRPIEPLSASRRLTRGELEKPGAVVGLLDISKAGGAAMLDLLSARLRRDYSGLTCRRLCKPTFSRPAPAALLAQARDCACIVTALAD